MLRRARIAVVAVSACALLAPAAASATCEPQHDWGHARQDLARRVVDLVNQHRASKGLQPLTVSRSLTRSALWKSRHMERYDYFEHDDPAPPVARSPHERAHACGYPEPGIGENIGWNYTSPESVMAGWLNSPGHRANIEESDYRTIGVGYAGAYWTQNFGMLDDSGNALPAAGPDAADTIEDVGVAQRVDVLANDTDDDLAWAYIGRVEQPAGGRVLVTEGDRALTYVPDPDFAGTDSFTYALHDLTGEVARGTVSVSVAGVNDAPVGVDDARALARRTRRASIGAVANDTDVDGDALRIVAIVKKPKRGSAKLSKGKIVYTPKGGIVRKDSLTYRVSDASGATGDAVVRISVRK